MAKNKQPVGGRPKPRLLSVAALALLLGSCSPRSEDPSWRTYTAQPTTFEQAVEELGVVESTRVANITAPRQGRIVSILEDGTPVNKGDVVLVLDTQDLAETLKDRIEDLKGVKKELEVAIEELRIALRSNQLDISSAEAQLDLARVQLADVNSNLSELEYLYSNDLVAQDQVREASSSVRRSQISTLSEDLGFRSKLTGAQSTERNKELGLERIALRGQDQRQRIDEVQEQISGSRMIAPVAGLFLRSKRWNWMQRKNVERQVGEEVREDEQLGQIPDLSALVVRSQIPERHLLNVREGQSVELLVEALGGAVFTGTVTNVGTVAIERETSAGGRATAGGQELSGEKVFEILVSIDTPDPRLKPSTTVRTRILLDREEDLLAVPINAIETTEAGHIVYLAPAHAKQSPQPRAVHLGRTNQELVEVVSGLAAGETVILRR